MAGVEQTLNSRHERGLIEAEYSEPVRQQTFMFPP